MSATPTERPESRAESESSADSTNQIADAVASLKREVSTAAREAVVLATIQVDRARVWARESAWTIGFVILEAVAILILLVVATIQFATGVCGAFEALFDSAWAGSLVGGIVGLAIAISLLLWAKSRMANANRERLRSKYESETLARSVAGKS